MRNFFRIDDSRLITKFLKAAFLLSVLSRCFSLPQIASPKYRCIMRAYILFLVRNFMQIDRLESPFFSLHWKRSRLSMRKWGGLYALLRLLTSQLNPELRALNFNQTKTLVSDQVKLNPENDCNESQIISISEVISHRPASSDLSKNCGRSLKRLKFCVLYTDVCNCNGYFRGQWNVKHFQMRFVRPFWSGQAKRNDETGHATALWS